MNSRKFGIEIEAYGVPMRSVAAALVAAGVQALDAGYTHRTTTYWKLVSDGSLHTLDNSFELVSPILEGEAGLAEIRKVCAVLNELGAKVNKKCGLHVHVDARDATQTNLANLLKQWAKFEGNFMELLPESRRNNNFCAKMFYNLDRDFQQIDAALRRDELRHMHGRYVTLNMQAFARHGTVEYRCHDGTVNGDKICAWVKLVTAFTHDAFSWKSIVKRGAGRFEYLTRLVDAKTARYLNERRAMMALPLTERTMNARAA